jgi:imidazolonepropionase-like amidohydrolase
MKSLAAAALAALLAGAAPAQVAPEAGAKLVDLRNGFMLPGLIDMHVNFYGDGDPLHERPTAANHDDENNVLIAAN